LPRTPPTIQLQKLTQLFLMVIIQYLFSLFSLIV
jgi:hypothetical protein